jgi:hypothetical protein
MLQLQEPMSMQAPETVLPTGTKVALFLSERKSHVYSITIWLYNEVEAARRLFLIRLQPPLGLLVPMSVPIGNSGPTDGVRKARSSL